MNEQELAEIKARAEAATPGPWDIGHAAPPLYASNSCITAKLGENMAIIFEANHNFELDKSADFIAHARQDIPALLAEVERLTQYAADCNALLIIEAAKAKDAKAEVERLRAYEDLVEDEILPFCARLGMLHDDGDALDLYRKIKDLEGGEG